MEFSSLDLGEHHGDIVRASVGVGARHELPAHILEVVVIVHDHIDLGVRDHIRETIRAEQVDVTCLQILEVDIDLDEFDGL